jgi:hypothetical protein
MRITADDGDWALALAEKIGIACEKRRERFAKAVLSAIARWRHERAAPPLSEVAAELVRLGRPTYLALCRPSRSAYARTANAYEALSPVARMELSRHANQGETLPDIAAVRRGDPAALNRLFALNQASPVVVEQATPHGRKRANWRIPPLGKEEWRYRGQPLTALRKTGRPVDEAGRWLARFLNVHVRIHVPTDLPLTEIQPELYVVLAETRRRLGLRCWPERKRSHAANDHWVKWIRKLYAPKNPRTAKPAGC